MGIGAAIFAGVVEENGRRERLLLLLAAAFVWVNALALSLVRTGGLHWAHLWGAAVWLLIMGSAHLLLERLRPQRDPVLLPLVGLLMGWGILLIDRLAANFLARQVMWVAVGTAVLLLVTLLPRDLRWLRRYRYTWLIGGLALLAATLIFGVNPTGSGAALWLPLPGQLFFFQPSELLKLLLLVYLASYFDEREMLLRLSHRAGGLFAPLPYLAPLLLMWGFCMVLLIWQQDLGAATLFFILFLALLYLATGNKWYVLGGLALLLLAGFIAYHLFDVVALRVDAWWNPWPEANNRAFQIVQSLYAVAAGGVFGQGIGQGFPNYIPVVHSDFAFAAIAEEWGLVGSVGVVALFAVLAHRGMRIAMMGKRPFQVYLAAGIAILFSFQALLIMGGVTKLLPLTGITLPFVSYGGSSLLVSSVMVGLLLYLSVNEGDTRSPLTPHLQQLMALLLGGFALIALGLFFWGTLRAEALLARSDNPRLVEAELRIQRGRILDRHAITLAENRGTVARQQRQYPITAVGPAVGYYSFRHGTAGVEESYNAILRGDGAAFWLEAWRKWLHEPQRGQDIQLTLDAAWQQEADSLLAAHAGALLLLELDEGGNVAQIRALVSHPGYDPNRLDEQFNALVADDSAPLLNRVTQGQYQPGLALQPFLLAAALDAGFLRLDEGVANVNRPVALNGTLFRCASRPLSDTTTWIDVLTNRCPAPMQELGLLLGETELERIFTAWGFTQQPQLPLNTTTAPQDPAQNIALAAIGQDVLTPTPLQVGLALAALANNGRFPALQLVTAVWQNNAWVAEPVTSDSSAAVSANAARSTRLALPVRNGVIEHSALALSGPGQSSDGWYLALAPAAAPRYVLVVVVENVESAEVAAEIGRTLWQKLEISE